MRILVTGASGYAGSALLAALRDSGHELRAFARDGARVSAALADLGEGPAVAVAIGDVLTGEGLARALDGIDVAYYLMHSMEPAQQRHLGPSERHAAQSFAVSARAAGVRRIVYLGGILPGRAPSAHLASRHAVEEILLEAVPGSIALRASIVIAARSRSFRLLVRLVERLPVLILPAWREYRTAPVDGRDVMEFLVAAAQAPMVASTSLDIAGSDVLTYGEIIRQIADAMLVARPSLRLGVSATALAAPIAAAIAGERTALIEPLMEGLGGDLLPRNRDAERLLGVRVHSFAAALQNALRDWEGREALAAR